jgi:hypothetical protein
VAGERRLQACQLLGWTAIEARHLGELSDAELREIELEENERRKDPTDYERSKNMSRRVEVVAKVLREQGGVLSNSDKNPKGGRPRKPDSQENIATRIGTTQERLSEGQTHVATADAFPFMQPWPQYRVLEEMAADLSSGYPTYP